MSLVTRREAAALYHPTPWTWEERDGGECFVYDALGKQIAGPLDRASAALIAASPVLHLFCLDLDRHQRRGAPQAAGEMMRHRLKAALEAATIDGRAACPTIIIPSIGKASR